MGANDKLIDIGEWLGVDAFTYIKIRLFFEELEELGTPNAKEALLALELIHSLMKAVR